MGPKIVVSSHFTRHFTFIWAIFVRIFMHNGFLFDSGFLFQCLQQAFNTYNFMRDERIWAKKWIGIFNFWNGDFVLVCVNPRAQSRMGPMWLVLSGVVDRYLEVGFAFRATTTKYWCWEDQMDDNKGLLPPLWANQGWSHVWPTPLWGLGFWIAIQNVVGRRVLPSGTYEKGPAAFGFVDLRTNPAA